LKPNHAERIASSKLLGQDEHMSPQNMQRHLSMLSTLVPRTSEASARLWIDTLFFRAAAMVPPNKSMILNIEYNIPSTAIYPTSSTSIGGKIGYTAIVADKKAAPFIFSTPQILSMKRRFPTGFFVTEGKLGCLDDHLPQAFTEMYEFAKTMEKDILRGALTNGHQWFFLILHLNQDGEGATYKQTLPFTILPSDNPAEPVGPDLIAGILSSWIEHSFEGLRDDDDWFEDVVV
ncbi:hypothetical protein B0H10DRAFT_2095408, partial [Mycena sp. CBHHK59/15]